MSAETTRREGYYIGTDQPHTDPHGFPLSPRGTLMFSGGYPTAGYAYFIQHRTGGPIKIGTSQDVYVRLREINTNSHDQGYVLLAHVEGGRDAERELHIEFRHLRLHGEWFAADTELLAYIEGLEDA